MHIERSSACRDACDSKLPVTTDDAPAFKKALLDAAMASVCAHADGALTRANGNIAMALLRLGKPQRALFFALSAMQADYCNVNAKAAYRAGMACSELFVPQAAAFFLSRG